MNFDNVFGNMTQEECEEPFILLLDVLTDDTVMKLLTEQLPRVIKEELSARWAREE